MKYTQSAGGIVINKRGQILVADQGGKSWSLPKGHIEKGEDILEAAKREIYEETGVNKLKLIKSLGSYKRTNINNPNEIKTIYMFLFETDQEELKPVDHHNHEARWVDKDKVADLLTHPKDKEFIQSIKLHFLAF